MAVGDLKAENNLPYVKFNKGYFSNLPISTTSTLSGSRVQNVISGQGATDTLLASQSGSTILFDRAAGIIYTLPVPQIGLSFAFIVTVSVTSNNHKVITDAGTTFLTGVVAQGLTTASPVLFVGNGSSHIATLMNGGTTGGLQGTKLEFTCTSATNWNVNGWNLGSSSNSTLFSTT